MLDELQARIKVARRDINNCRYADGITLMAESEEELKRVLIKVKEESEKAGLKLNMTQDPACLGLVHGDDPERCYGEGGGRGVHVWERM